MKEHGERNVAILGIMVQEGPRMEITACRKKGPLKLALTERGLAAPRRAGEIAGETRIGNGVDQEEVTKLLKKLEGGAGAGAVLNDRLDLVAAAAPVGDTGYSVVEVFPLAPFQKATPAIAGLFAILA